MNKDYFYRVILELDEDASEDKNTLAFDFSDGERATRFAEMAYNACDIINVSINIVHNENDTTNSPMWRIGFIKQLLNSKYGYLDTDSVKEARYHEATH